MREVKEGNGPPRYFDRHGHELHFERDTQKAIWPIYTTHSLAEIAHRHLEVWLAKEEQTGDWSTPDFSEEQIPLCRPRHGGPLAAAGDPASLLYKNRLARAAQIEFNCLPATAEIEYAGMPFDAARTWEMEAGAREKAGEAR